MRDPLQRQIQQVRDCEISASYVELSGYDLSPPHRDDFQVD